MTRSVKAGELIPSRPVSVDQIASFLKKPGHGRTGEGERPSGKLALTGARWNLSIVPDSLQPCLQEKSQCFDIFA